MAITNAQQYQQILQKEREEKAFGGLLGLDGRRAYVGGSYAETSPGSGKERGSYQGRDDSGGYGGNYSGGDGGADSSYVTPTQEANNAAAIAKGKAEKAAADKKAAEAKAKEEKKQEKKEAKAKAKKDKKTKRMQKAAFDRFQKLEKYVDVMDDYGATGEELAKATGFKGNIETGFEYDKDFFRDSKTGKIKDQFTEMVDINKGKTDIFGRPKEPKFVEQFKSDAIPGYDFSINPVNTNFDGGLGTLTSYPGGVRPNDYGIQIPTGTSLDILSNIIRPEDGLQAFNTLEEARNVQDFAGRFQGGDDSAYQEFEDYVSRNTPTSTGGGGGGNQQQTDPCLGPNPPAYCAVNNDPADPTTPTRNLGGLAPRFAGSIFDFTGLANGGRAGFKDGEGIMQMASSPDPMDERNMVMETIAMQEFGKPLSDLSEDEIIQIEMFIDEMSKRKNEPRVMAQQGGRMMNDDDPTGGIMDLESGRQMYFLGKLVKKATRAVKKVVKSPIGKAALMYGLGSIGGSYGLTGKLFSKGMLNPMNMKAGLFGANSLMMNKLGMGEMAAKKGLFGKLGLTSGYGGLMPTLKGGITLGLGVPALMDLFGKKEEEDDGLDDYYRKNSIDIADIRNRPYNFLAPRIAGSMFAADGGLMRTGYAEGSKEPVAKETMPLIDMDGKEMDLREDGGFVPLGRMERADDVPARLSKNEFVFTADAVRNAGEGDIDKGAEVMYNMMKNLESGGEVSEESQGLEGAREMFQTSQRLEEVL